MRNTMSLFSRPAGPLCVLATAIAAASLSLPAGAQVQVLDKPFRPVSRVAQASTAVPAPRAAAGVDLPIDAMPAVPARPPVAVLPAPAPNPVAVVPSAVARPAPAQAPITVVASPPPPPVAPPAASVWEIQLSDGTLSKALIRWSRASGLPMLWEAGKDMPAVTARYQGSYLDVLESVMADTARSQYPLHACAYDNVVRILHVAQSCMR